METPGRVEPLFLADDDILYPLIELIEEVKREAFDLAASIHPDTRAVLRRIVMMANALHSNAIEGHHASVGDVAHAMEGQNHAAVHPMTTEAIAHIRAERVVDRYLVDPSSIERSAQSHLRESLEATPAKPQIASSDFVKAAHKSLYLGMPDEFLKMQRPDGPEIAIVPGEFRKTPDEDVVVGRHQPPASDRVAEFMDHFTKRFAMVGKEDVSQIAAIPAAHHRLAYIHPFPDGNGRVCRLLAHAMAQQAGIGADGLWSISRGLAVGRKQANEYRKMMDHADSPRRGDRDGRGNLSLSALKEYVDWFLLVILDQIRLSMATFEPSALTERISEFAGHSGPTPWITAIIREGTVKLSEVEREASAGGLLGRLIKEGLLQKTLSGSTLSLSIPPRLYGKLFPEMFAQRREPAARMYVDSGPSVI